MEIMQVTCFKWDGRDYSIEIPSSHLFGMSAENFKLAKEDYQDFSGAYLFSLLDENMKAVDFFTSHWKWAV
ncbi:hypothetical protein JXA02_04045 [candidate division KSB1 bacterium]|nr:hypothetical protein [candidate division KSB1 bacterium]RQW09100.1 MAG: hypothetical protein EH222_04530 [candidate division KSB1 bacterium]